MVSILGDYYYEFPQPKPLKLHLKDMLEYNVDEKYYLSNKTIDMFVKHTEKKQAEGCGFKFEPTDGGGMLNVSPQEQDKEQTTILLKPAHGYYKGEIMKSNLSPTIDTGVGCWHTLIGEKK